MPQSSRIERLEVSVGGRSRSELRSALAEAGVQLNVHAETLLDADVFDGGEERMITVTERTVGELGGTQGATLPEIFRLAGEQALLVCPPETGPYLRLALGEQATSANSVLSTGTAPEGSLTVVSDVLDDDVAYPKGFYLRVVDGVPWLRGYRCDDEHVWSPEDRLLFRVA